VDSTQYHHAVLLTREYLYVSSLQHRKMGEILLIVIFDHILASGLFTMKNVTTFFIKQLKFHVKKVVTVTYNPVT
jgi:hypothetical protein